MNLNKVVEMFDRIDLLNLDVLNFDFLMDNRNELYN